MGNKQSIDELRNGQSEHVKVLKSVLEKQDSSEIQEEDSKRKEKEGIGETQKENDENRESEYLDKKQGQNEQEKEVQYSSDNQVEDVKNCEKDEVDIPTDKENNEENKSRDLRDIKNGDDNWESLIENKEEVQETCCEENENKECFEAGEEFAMIKDKHENHAEEVEDICYSISHCDSKPKENIKNINSKENLLEEYKDNSESDFSVINIETIQDKYELNFKEDETDFPENLNAEKEKINQHNEAPLVQSENVNIGIFRTSMSTEETDKQEETSKNVRVYKNEGPITEISRAKTTLKENLSDDAKDALASLETNYKLAESDMAALAFLTTIDADDSTKGNLAIALLEFVCDDVRTCVLEHLALDRGLVLVKAQPNEEENDEKFTNDEENDEKLTKTIETSNLSFNSREYSQIYILEEKW